MSNRRARYPSIPSEMPGATNSTIAIPMRPCEIAYRKNGSAARRSRVMKFGSVHGPRGGAPGVRRSAIGGVRAGCRGERAHAVERARELGAVGGGTVGLFPEPAGLRGANRLGGAVR